MGGACLKKDGQKGREAKTAQLNLEEFPFRSGVFTGDRKWRESGDDDPFESALKRSIE